MGVEMSTDNVWLVTDWNNDKMHDWSFAYLKNSQSYLVFYTWDVPIAKVLNKEHAQLIAAAPEMLEALEDAYAILGELVKYPDCPEWGAIRTAYKRFNATIAKAKGEQP